MTTAETLKLFKEMSWRVWSGIAPDIGGMYDIEGPDAQEILELIFDASRMDPEWSGSFVHGEFTAEQYKEMLAMYHDVEGARKMMEITATY